ncbi:hypothetical protein H6G81_27530 [Scytonema hofmannii FACHB-248]|uniref:Uncharacterized protein n=1 Tax=Scytonema hofmannii FACHB-248 TaxID=1842502 RepID=A0ABR8GYS4_9CYAN|nr:MULTISPECIES: hypothetical protein [Nostocales]MBD2608165.1 hypothetical protein [Scytonema hofmannii FACHB-248]
MEQLEQNYKALYKYFVGFKSQLEDLKQQLHQPSEIDPLQVLQSQVYALQRQLQDSETVSDVGDAATTEMIVDNAEIATPIFELDIDTKAQERITFTALSNDEFKLERMIWLIDIFDRSAKKPA